jgi:hypothetical protein
MVAVRLWSVRQRVQLSHLLCWDNTDQDTKDDVMLWLHVDYELWVVSLSCRFRLLTLALNKSFRGTLYERGALLSFIFSLHLSGFLFMFILFRVALRRSHIHQFRLTRLMINVHTDDMHFFA